jgi:tetratricopeptide (TPR) repeat protein
LESADDAVIIADDLDDKKSEATALAIKGDIYLANSDYLKSFEYYLQADYAIQKTSDKKQANLSNNRIGDLLLDMELYEKAIGYFEKVEAKDGSSENLKNEQKIAYAYFLGGDLANSKAKYQDLENKYETKKDQSNLLETKKQIALILDKEKDYSSSLSKKEEVLSLALQSTGSEVEVAKAYNNLGFAYQKSGVAPKAQENFEKSYAAYEKQPESKYFAEQIILLNNLAVVGQNQGNTNYATEKLQTASKLPGTIRIPKAKLSSPTC